MRPDGSTKPEGFIPPPGGYEKLLSYQKSQIVYDALEHRAKQVRSAP